MADKMRSVNTGFWDDPYIQALSAEEKLLFIYALTNPLTTIAGLYEITPRRMCFDTGFTEETVNNALCKFELDGKAKYENGYLALKNFIPHQRFNTNMAKGAVEVMRNSPDDLVNWILFDEDGVPSKAYETLSKTLEDSERLLKSGLKRKGKGKGKLEKERSQAEPSTPSFTEAHHKLASLLAELIEQQDDKVFNGKNREKTVASWADDIRKLNSIDGRENSEIETIIRWSQDNDFWHSNILSGQALRKNYPKLRAQAFNGKNKREPFANADSSYYEEEANV